MKITRTHTATGRYAPKEVANNPEALNICSWSNDGISLSAKKEGETYEVLLTWGEVMKIVAIKERKGKEHKERPL